MSRGTKSFWRKACDSNDEVQWAFLEWGMLYHGYFESNNSYIMILNKNEYEHVIERGYFESFFHPRYDIQSKNEVYDDFDMYGRESQERVIWSIYNEFGYVDALIYAVKTKIHMEDFGGTDLYKNMVRDRYLVNAIIEGNADISEIHRKTSWDRQGNQQDYFEGHRQELITFINDKQITARESMKKEREIRVRACWAKARGENNKNKFKERSAQILGKVFKIKAALSSS